MRWIQIGEKAHAVTRKNGGRTLCRLELSRVDAIVVSPPFEERCGSCDNEWRRRGRLTKKRTHAHVADDYRPRFTFADFEHE